MISTKGVQRKVLKGKRPLVTFFTINIQPRNAGTFAFNSKFKNFPMGGGGANGGDTIAVSVSVENDFKGDVLPQASGHV